MEVGQGNTTTHSSICLIQITRIGDILQTYQAAKQFKAEHPNIRLILIARKQFARPLDFLLKDTFEKIFYLDLKSITPEGDETSLQNAHKNLTMFINEINNQKISVCINLSFSKSSSYLATLINCRHKLGLTASANGAPQVMDRWGQYIYSVVMRGALNPFSLVDLYRWFLGSKQLNTLNGKARNQKSDKITLHPFASHGKKYWPAYKWAEIIYALVKKNPEKKINIVGSAHDEQDAIKIFSNPILKDFQQQIFNHTGNTALSDVFRLVGESDLFIGHDSMVGHLASIQKIKSITISLGTVRPHETTPYGEGNLNLAPTIGCFPCFPTDPCQNYLCHGDIAPQAVAQLAESMIDGGTKNLTEKIISIESNYHSKSAFYVTEIGENKSMSVAGRNDDYALSGIFRTFYKILWSFVMNNEEVKVSFPKVGKEINEELIKHRQAIHKLYELSEFGLSYVFKLMDTIEKQPHNIASMKEVSSKLADVEQLEGALKQSFPLLAPLVDFYYVVRANASGKDLLEITQNSVLAFTEQRDSIRILFDLIDQTIQYNTKEKNNLSLTKQAERGQ